MMSKYSRYALVLLRAILVVVSSLAMLLFAASEVLLAMPVPSWLYSAATVMFAVGLLKKRPAPQQPGRLAAVTVICVAAIVLHLVPWSGRNAFLKDLYSIRPGMTVAEVRASMSGYMEGTGIPANPLDESPKPPGEFTVRGALVFRHSNDPAYNADWGIVYFEDGRVTKVEFSAD